MIAATFLASLVSVAAFAPARMASKASSLKMSYENAPGALPPFGFFDPFGLADNIDQATFDQYRAAEIKHGRVSQLAVIGYIVPEIFRFPGDVSPGLPFASVPNGVAAIEAIPTLGWFQIVFLIGAVDYWGYLQSGVSGLPSFPTAYGADKTPEQLAEQEVKEINNGRLAMLAILELLRHDAQMVVGGMYAGDNLITGLPFLY
jgi:hypothetical protein